MMKRVEATVYGRVQGVSFRYYTRRAAGELGLTGWVANRHNGSVYVVAEGSAASLDRLVDFLHQGAPSAHVDHVVTRWAEATGEFTDFAIRWL